jgi:predicted nuclease of predicted toxin-antitoxin system
MRFIADKNIPNGLILAIQRKGHSIKCLNEENLTGISDHELLAIAKKEQRIIITFDKDFTNLLQFPLKSHIGIIVLRWHSPKSE